MKRIKRVTPTIELLTAEVIKSFFAQVKKLRNGCWLWCGSFDKDGYGLFSLAGSVRRAHRLMWMKKHGVWPDSLDFVCHDCPTGDNPSCVNPDHLFLGDAKINAADTAKKGRTAKGDRNGARLYPERIKLAVKRGDEHWSRLNPEKRATGERHGSHTHPESRQVGSKNPMSKLTYDQACEIRCRYAKGGISQLKLAELYGVTQGCISGITRCKSYREAA